MAKVAARDLQKEAAWRRRLGQQAKSGQSVRAWCRKHRVTETAFYWWRRELARRDAEAPAASFVPRAGGHGAGAGRRLATRRSRLCWRTGGCVRLTGPVEWSDVAG